jgi:chaperone required for assembly of F1-ATPase
MKRFYKKASVAEHDGAYAVHLDGKPIRTPSGKSLSVPSRALAEAIAGEWDSRGEIFEPADMLLTRLANATVIRGPSERNSLIERILAFGPTDLLCYRAEEQELAAQQGGEWDPVLAWLAEVHGARLNVTTGIGPVPQPAEAAPALRKAVEGFDAFELTSLYAATTAAGSLVLGLAMVSGEIDAARAFRLSRLDEDHQAKKWGEDREADVRARKLQAELEAAEEFLRLSRS